MHVTRSGEAAVVVGPSSCCTRFDFRKVHESRAGALDTDACEVEERLGMTRSHPRNRQYGPLEVYRNFVTVAPLGHQWR